MKILLTILCLSTFGLVAQPRKVIETVQLSGQTMLEVEFDFADQIVFKTWDRNEVKVEVDVSINDGADNDKFSIGIKERSSTIYMETPEELWKKIARREKHGRSETYTYDAEINYIVYLPRNMDVKASTIAGNYELEYFGTAVELKTISGEIDITIPEKEAFDFKAKTLSGEVFTDVDISFPRGKDGLRQMIGQDVYGRVRTGGTESAFETISGNIYLRQG